MSFPYNFSLRFCSRVERREGLDLLIDPVVMLEPIACTLTPGAIKAGRAGLLPGLADRASTREATDDGYRLTFPASSEALTAIMAVIDAERQCRKWLTFALTVSPSDGPIVLTLAGQPGAREFLDALFEVEAAERIVASQAVGR